MTDRVETLVRGTVVDVLTGTLEDRAVAIDGGEIVGFDERPADRELEVAYVAPGLINTHMHVESTMLTLPRYADEAFLESAGIRPPGIARWARERGIDPPPGDLAEAIAASEATP
jgi:hypothetical protein